MKTKSFTLIELLVVIVIIGILAGVIIVSTSSSINKANIAKSKVFESNIQNELGANMVSRWKLDEIVGTTTTPDAWGNNTGILGDGVTTSTYPTLKEEAECVTGKCMYFDGIDDYVMVENSSDLNGTNEGFTISLWVNSSLSDWDNASYPSIIEKGVGAGWTSGQYYIAAWGDSLRFQVNNISSDGLSMSYPSSNTWHYFFMTYDGSYIVAGIDGVLSGPKTSVLVDANSSYLLIGKSSSKAFRGLIDDVRIYNAALSTSQIKQEYIAGLNSLLASNNISSEEYNERIETLSNIDFLK